MSFLSRLTSVEPYDTWLGMEKAAEERFWDGLTLLLSEENRGTGGIYLLGYTAEILLKTAFFRFIGIAGTEDLWIKGGGFDTAKTHSGWKGKNLHDLLGWIDLLIDERTTAGKPLNPVIAGQADLHVKLVNNHWREILRYKYTDASDNEIAEVYQGVEWIRDNHHLLWS